MAQTQNDNLICNLTSWFVAVALVLSLLSFNSPTATTVNRSNQPTQTEIYRHTLTYNHLAGYYDQSELPSLRFCSSVNYTPAYLSAVYSRKTSVQFKEYTENLSETQFHAFTLYTPRSMTESLAIPLRG